MHFLMIEAGDIQPGAALMVSRLIDLVVIRTLRSWVHRGPRPDGWEGFPILVLPVLSRLFMSGLCERWSIETLAGIAGMSRSSFCERFTALVGRPPLRYQNEWRLALARDLLARRSARIGEIGFSIGYEVRGLLQPRLQGPVRSFAARRIWTAQRYWPPSAIISSAHDRKRGLQPITSTSLPRTCPHSLTRCASEIFSSG